MGIARFQPSQLFGVVNDNTSTYWMPLGMDIGFTYDQVISTADSFTNSLKLNAIYQRKCSEVGEYRAVARLITAVQAGNRMGAVEDSLPGGIKSIGSFSLLYCITLVVLQSPLLWRNHAPTMVSDFLSSDGCYVCLYMLRSRAVGHRRHSTDSR